MVTTTENKIKAYTSFEELEENFWDDQPAPEYEYPWDSSAVREALIAYKVPFTVVDAGERESSFKDAQGNPQVKFWFHINLHTDTENYQAAYRLANLLPKYELTIEAGGNMIGKRRAQLNLILAQIENLGSCQAVLAKGGKSGKEMLFKSVDTLG